MYQSTQGKIQYTPNIHASLQQYLHLAFIFMSWPLYANFSWCFKFWAHVKDSLISTCSFMQNAAEQVKTLVKKQQKQNKDEQQQKYSICKT